MKETLIPFAHANNIYEINIDFYVSLGIKVLFIDLDNTLDSYKCKTPSERAKDLITKLLSSGIRPIIVSNNRGKRVKNYAKELNIECLYSAFKPFPNKLNKFIKENNIDKNECLIIGDQLLTDIKLGKNSNIKTILLEKLVKEDQFTTHFNRIFDKMIRKRLKKKNLLRDWREIYGKSKKST